MVLSYLWKLALVALFLMAAFLAPSLLLRQQTADAIIIITQPTSDVDITTGLVGYWKFEGNGNDSSGQGRNLTATGTPTYVTGQVGQATSLSGSGQYWTSSAFDNGASDQRSLSMWAKNTNDTVTTLQGLALKNDSVFELFAGNYPHKLSVYQGNGGWHETANSSDFTSGWSSWHHYVVVYNGATTKIYRDTVEVGTSNQTGNLPASNASFRIGWSSGGGGSYWNGQIDEVRLYTIALSAAQRSAIYTTEGGS